LQEHRGSDKKEAILVDRRPLMPTRHDRVVFEFFHATEQPEVLYGEVLIRNGEMILEVELPEEGPYHIRGERLDTFFQGRHEGQPGDVPVRAKWILLDDMYVGIWVEDGKEYMFKFCLPSGE